ncbi:hypothetical protein J7S47_26205, partial [Citrobacter freundii]|nr:hypothetical protein [Citrobacter freundii]MBQ0234593.1 hypothetical protein [Citrobacter freundii]
FIVGGPVGDFELLLCHGTVCVVGKIRDLILQLSKSSIYSTKPSMIKDLELSLSDYDLNLLDLLSQDIVQQARYPIGIIKDELYLKTINERNANLANNKLFNEMVSLYDKIKSMVVKLDNDVENCAHFNSLTFKDLSFFMRGGGGLNARCIVIYSSDYPQEKKTKSYLKSILDRNPNGIMRWYTVYWDEYNFFEDTGKKLIPLKD